jgi:hypothetical protein
MEVISATLSDAGRPPGCARSAGFSRICPTVDRSISTRQDYEGCGPTWRISVWVGVSPLIRDGEGQRVQRDSAGETDGVRGPIEGADEGGYPTSGPRLNVGAVRLEGNLHEAFAGKVLEPIVARFAHRGALVR